MQVFSLEVLGAIPGLSQADPPPKSLAWGASGCPRLGWGSWRHSSGEQPPASYITGAAWESPGREAAELLGFFLFLCQAVPFALLFLFLQRRSALLQRGCLSPIIGASIIFQAPSLPPRCLMLPQRKASITVCPGIVRGWAWGGGSAGAQMPWQGEHRGWHGQRVGGVRI